jgi:hypothetical protein
MLEGFAMALVARPDLLAIECEAVVGDHAATAHGLKNTTCTTLCSMPAIAAQQALVLAIWHTCHRCNFD